jgi:hypothetical protein
MAQMPSPTTTPDPVTPDAFLADRQQFWSAFCSFTIFSAVAIGVLLVLMLVFLV